MFAVHTMLPRLEYMSLKNFKDKMELQINGVTWKSHAMNYLP